MATIKAPHVDANVIYFILNISSCTQKTTMWMPWWSQSFEKQMRWKLKIQTYLNIMQVVCTWFVWRWLQCKTIWFSDSTSLSNCIFLSTHVLDAWKKKQWWENQMHCASHLFQVLNIALPFSSDMKQTTIIMVTQIYMFYMALQRVNLCD